jgi:hypothetical protein
MGIVTTTNIALQSIVIEGLRENDQHLSTLEGDERRNFLFLLILFSQETV